MHWKFIMRIWFKYMQLICKHPVILGWILNWDRMLNAITTLKWCVNKWIWMFDLVYYAKNWSQIIEQHHSRFKHRALVADALVRRPSRIDIILIQINSSALKSNNIFVWPVNIEFKIHNWNKLEGQGFEVEFRFN